MGIQAIMGTVAAQSAITAVARSAAKRATPVAITALDAATDTDRPSATASKKK